MKIFLLLMAAFLGAACDGPITPTPPLASPLRISAMPVAGHLLDTIWVERLQPINLARRGLAFVKPGSWLKVIRLGDRPDTVDYLPSADQPRAWLPARQAMVEYGTAYALQAHMVWNDAPDFPAGDHTRSDDIRGDARTPDRFAVRKQVLAPLEMLFKSLSGGALEGTSSSLRAALVAENPARVDSQNVSEATCDSLLRGLPVMRPASSGDTLWNLLGENLVTDLFGRSLQSGLRQMVVNLDVDHAHWGGLVSAHQFDPGRARILTVIQRVAYRSEHNGKVVLNTQDSIELFQPGHSRMLSKDQPDQPSLVGYPDQMLLPSMGLAYTGRNTLKLLAVEASYLKYSDLMMKNNSGAWIYTSLQGALGYFAGAASDSLEFQIKAVADTFAVPALRAAACRDLAVSAPQARPTWFQQECAPRQ